MSYPLLRCAVIQLGGVKTGPRIYRGAQTFLWFPSSQARLKAAPHCSHANASPEPPGVASIFRTFGALCRDKINIAKQACWTNMVGRCTHFSTKQRSNVARVPSRLLWRRRLSCRAIMHDGSGIRPAGSSLNVQWR